MTVLTLKAAGRFRLDRDRLAAHMIDRGTEPGGFDTHHEGGFAAAVADRFTDAWDSGAILAPPGTIPILYPLGTDALILALRERDMPPTVSWPLRQVATASFDVDEIACFGDESFDECCRALTELARRAEALLPALTAIRSSGQEAA